MNSPYWNQGEGLREIAKVLEIRNANDMIKSDQQVQQEQQQAQAAQQQEMFIEKVLDTESAMAVADQGAKFKAQQASARSSGKNPPRPGATKRPEGRPAGPNHQPGLKGANEESAVREFSQAMGANSIGLPGL
jgi:hypothetical protein